MATRENSLLCSRSPLDHALIGVKFVWQQVDSDMDQSEAQEHIRDRTWRRIS